MGVSLPDLPPSTSEDNINLGEKDSIRRRALWALEGKQDVSYSKVQIPELSATESPFRPMPSPTNDRFPTSKPTFSGSGSVFSSVNKRDSFKLLAQSSSSKDQLHTLMEEEEEEEESELAVPTPVTPTVAIIKPSPARPRPATLNLRPLSLTPDSLVSTTQGLPTPSLTPSPRSGFLKSFSLAPQDNLSTKVTKRQSLISTAPSTSSSRSPLSDSPSPMSTDKPARRSSISYKSSSQYSSPAGLPTPEMTPTSTIAERRYSGASSASGDDGDFLPHQTSRPLSASEQHFLFKSHNALLARITDLERALSSRSRASMSMNAMSRPVSYAASDISSSDSMVSNEPSDEMLRLIADLKAERDELKRDVDGWRTRVGDLEKQVGVFAKRLEAERRDAWVARSRVGLLEVEKSVLEKSLKAKGEEVEVALRGVVSLKGDVEALESECEALKLQASRSRGAEAECARLRQELEAEKKRREDLEKELEKADLLATPTPKALQTAFTNIPIGRRRGLGFTSLDSESSATDVEPDFVAGFGLKSVQEENREDYLSDEDVNGLAGYEDEEDSDASFQSPDGSQSSLGSVDDFRARLDVVTPDLSTSGSGTPTVRSRSSSPLPADDIEEVSRPTHASHASLSKTWTFPIGVQIPSSAKEREPEIDRFFGCLDDMDASPPAGGAIPTYESSKGMFAMGFNYGRVGDDDDDDMPPFLLPAHVGVEEVVQRGLEVVMEEDEEEEEEDEIKEEKSEEFEEEEIFGDVAGIKITFTPPDEAGEEESRVSFNAPAPVFFDEEDEEESAASFNFGRPVHQPVQTETPPSSKVNTSTSSSIPTPPPSIPRASSPSSIPRVASPSSIPRISTFSETVSSTPPKSKTASPLSRFTPPTRCASNSTALVTPPTKRGGAMPSFIPQPVSSPSPMRNTTRSTPPAFIRQPQRKPLPSLNLATKNQASASTSSHGSTFKPQPRTCIY